jgi:hypothetical protein
MIHNRRRSGSCCSSGNILATHPIKSSQLVLATQPQDDYTCGRSRLVSMHVGEIHVQGDECTPFVLAALIDPGVVSAAQRLLLDARRIMSGAAQQIANLPRQVSRRP